MAVVIPIYCYCYCYCYCFFTLAQNAVEASSNHVSTNPLLRDHHPLWSLPSKSTALVTGGTKGIGHAIVTQLAETFHAKVLTCARNATELEECLNEWNQRGMDVHGVVADLSTSQGRDTVMNKLKEMIHQNDCAHVGRLDILINNVGTNRRKKTIDYTEDDFDFIIATNLKSMYELTKLCHPYLKRPRVVAVDEETSYCASPSSVVNIGSVAGVTCMKSGTLYASTKAAMNQITGNWACEWGPDGIRVNCVAPWYINTPLARQVLNNPDFKR